MSRMTSNHHSNRVTFKRASLCVAAFLLLTLLPLEGRLPKTRRVLCREPRRLTSQRRTAQSSSQVAGKPNLAGTWKLNADQSDNPMQKMRQAQQDSGDQGGGGGRRGGGYGGGGGMGGRGGGGGAAKMAADRMPATEINRAVKRAASRAGVAGARAEGMRGMATLVIEQTPTSAKVSDTLRPSAGALFGIPGKGSPASSANSANDGREPAPAVAQWQDNKLVATQQMRNGGTTTRTLRTLAR